MEQLWSSVCEVSDLIPDTGVCVKIGDYQAAIFYISQSDEYLAIGNYDPIGKANVLSRGLICSIGDNITVASPLYKQHFDLRTGECLEDEDVSVPSFPLRVVDGNIELSLPVAGSEQQAA